MTTTTTRPPRNRPVLDDDDDDDDSDVEHTRRPPLKLRPSMRGIRQSLAATQLHRRHRRRSSARFLRLHHNGSNGDNDDDEDVMDNSNGGCSNSTNLQELYQKAIRLNAENKINASNSWSLKLIENIDNFLLEEDEEDNNNNESESSKNDVRNNNENSSQATKTSTTTNKQTRSSGNNSSSRVNFTKASCTLDASVKIYSYRVDDVHLTSYKVLANLNRSDTNQKEQQQQQQNKRGDENGDAEEPEGGGGSSNKSRSRAAAAGSTIESHLANINLNKLDSAFDIDPLFSKMSKTFDEGGAKGLLLVNLGVGAQGCNIVFDSSCDDVEQEQPLEDETPLRRRGEGMIDISNLTSKLDSLLQQQSEAETMGSFLDREAIMASLPLVPQLLQLRSQFAELEAQGFVSDGPETPVRHRHKRKSQFYGVSEQEEKEADRSIHQEAIERSRASVGRSFVLSEVSRTDDQDEDEYGADDLGGGYDEDDDDDIGFDQFIASEEARLSAISFDGSVTDHREEDNKTTTALLDALADSPTLWATGDQYAYWNTNATHLLHHANHWAGVAHWNMKQRRAPALCSTAKAPKKTPAKKSKRPAILVDLSADASNLDAILFSSMKKSSKPQKLQWSQTTITKHGRNENVLPLDAGIGVEQLASLFLRPDTVLERRDASSGGSNSGSSSSTSSPGAPKKQVGFAAGPWDDASFGGGGGAFDDGVDDDDDDGPGFVLASQAADEDFGVAELEGVRKVEKVRVGYATVAKKVDVKRLKKDLWKEMEQVLLRKKNAVDISAMDDGETKEQQQEEEDDPLEEEEMNSSNKCMSFQQTVRDMEESKSQADVTLPFYFICVLHLANEKGLRLDSKSLEDFDIYHDGVVGGPSF